jgi:hypothetical protein
MSKRESIYPLVVAMAMRIRHAAFTQQSDDLLENIALRLHPEDFYLLKCDISWQHIASFSSGYDAPRDQIFICGLPVMVDLASKRILLRMIP